jgi:hypothetical protein
MECDATVFVSVVDIAKEICEILLHTILMGERAIQT